MARRTDHSRDELFGLILDESQKIIESSGISSLTARNIAAAIGYSPGTLYNLFSNIDDIILHLNGRTLESLYTTLEQEVNRGSGRERLDRVLSIYLAFTRSAGQRWNLLFEHHLHEGVSLPDWYRELVDGLLTLLERVLTDLLPGCGEREIKHSAQVLWCGLHGICSLAGENKLTGISSRSVDEMARSLVYNYISGLKRAD